MQLATICFADKHGTVHTWRSARMETLVEHGIACEGYATTYKYVCKTSNNSAREKTGAALRGLCWLACMNRLEYGRCMNGESPRRNPPQYVPRVDNNTRKHQHHDIYQPLCLFYGYKCMPHACYLTLRLAHMPRPARARRSSRLRVMLAAVPVFLRTLLVHAI